MTVEVEWYRNSQRLGGDPKNAGGDFKIVANKNTRQLVLNQFKSDQERSQFNFSTKNTIFGNENKEIPKRPEHILLKSFNPLS